jgi:hypothetical protein
LRWPKRCFGSNISLRKELSKRPTE